MPSNTSMNLRTSAAAAFCARLIVHPLDNVKVSIQSYQGLPVGLVPRLEHLLTTLRQQLHVQHRKHHRNQIQYHHQFKHSYSSVSAPRHFYQEKISVVRGLYRGVPFALIFQVPGLALFLSTYDATKHALAQTAQAANIQGFQLHDFETHLVSGMIARAAASIVWAPMMKLQSLAVHPSLGQAQLSLKAAFRLTKQICNSEGVAGMWSGYTKSLATLLPYTMLYFATYEHFKQFARKIIANGTEKDYQATFPEKLQRLMTLFTSSNNGSHSSVELSLQTYMVCVTSAVATSSTICQSATAVRDRLQQRQAARLATRVSDVSSQVATTRRPPILSNLLHTMSSARQEIVSPLNSPTRIVSPLSAASAISTTAGASAGFRHHPLMPQFKTLMSNTSQIASQTMSGLPWQQAQHATLTTNSSTSGLLPFRTSMKAHLSHPIQAMKYRQIMTPLTHTPSSMVHPSTVAHFSSHNIVSRPLGALTPHTLMNNTTATTLTTSGYVQATTPMTHAMTRYDSNDTRMAKNSNYSKQLSQSTQQQPQPKKTPGLVRMIARGLGPRVMWTVPSVALTTAGFEVLRNMAAN
ncbi:hypothetical protein BG006_003228 [Podila minutissima]|uniref:Mitochondrial carrier protein n=1 Tax=Podila minutissima TaxID=64525 RepID=A0A9P5SMK4_9FUNG|nr:hypothetical protein BG006_003228 [Podila minutissima]